LCNELLSCGVSVGDLIPMMTTRPAAAIGRPELGCCGVGADADLTVLRIEEGSFEVRDVDGRARRTTKRIFVHATVRSGVYYPGSAEGEAS
jgi:dihydroorotase